VPRHVVSMFAPKGFSSIRGSLGEACGEDRGCLDCGITVMLSLLRNVQASAMQVLGMRSGWSSGRRL